VLARRLDEVRKRIEAAAARAGRTARDVTLVAVTKKFPASLICEAYRLGVRDFGENYVQEFEGKYAAVAGLTDARFHLIGHLQSNKTRPASLMFHMIQTVDTPKLARRLDAEGKQLDVMLEVKLSPEQSKAGADSQSLDELIAAVRQCRNLKLAGLMTMPPWTDDAEPSRPYFVRLRELAQKHSLPQLSMGMSHDFEVAIEEGSTCVRIGTALFGPRPKPPAASPANPPTEPRPNPPTEPRP
jgi:pyridoxal phosphate enzyme (YggS family)